MVCPLLVLSCVTLCSAFGGNIGGLKYNEDNSQPISVQSLSDDDDVIPPAAVGQYNFVSSTTGEEDGTSSPTTTTTTTTTSTTASPITTTSSSSTTPSPAPKEPPKVNVSGNPYIAALKKKPWESQHGYVNIREDCFMFWWLYYAGGTRKKSSKKPLIIWIQGGPGLAASGIANFGEIGPLTVDFKPRNHTWVKNYNVLLIDHPVGTGFSFALNDNPDMYAYDDKTIALDLMKTVKGFLRLNPEFRYTPTYIMSQSYGGKIAPRLAYMMHKAVQTDYMKINLKGVGIGSAWVDPGEISKTVPQYLYHMGLIDASTFRNTSKYTNKMVQLISNGYYLEAQGVAYDIFREYYKNNMIESVLNVAKPDQWKFMPDLEERMNKYVKPTLHMVKKARTWSYQSDAVYDRLKESVMQPATQYVEKLLNETTLTVVVYNGNMDATCPMAGAVNWVHNLRWNGTKEFRKEMRSQIPGVLSGYYKAVGQLSLWWVLNAGHWVPEDNPEAMDHILHFMTQHTPELYYAQSTTN